MVQNLFHVSDCDAGKQGHAAAQAVFVVGDFTAHRRFGDRCYFSFATRRIGDFIDALDIDQGGIHVKCDQLEIPQAKRRREVLDHETGGEFSHANFQF